MLTKFTGFKGVVAFAEIDGIQFALLASNQRQLAILWNGILTQAGPLDPAGVKRAILIEANTLPSRATGKGQGAAHLAQNTQTEPPTIEV